MDGIGIKHNMKSNIYHFMIFILLRSFGLASSFAVFRFHGQIEELLL
jgi:hypothetical protein